MASREILLHLTHTQPHPYQHGFASVYLTSGIVLKTTPRRSNRENLMQLNVGHISRFIKVRRSKLVSKIYTISIFIEHNLFIFVKMKTLLLYYRIILTKRRKRNVKTIQKKFDS
ncbi:hypothetical protein O3G_MSEX012211 [Manduca sexta]|uniref:Uncharacterized protein n=1 Tax=Manduca sexta TaxID=7130 RepID=A0A921ZMV1_MANSE|nr:hypothetical protein O3G_MSEX012211 [Manduca sexta]KAG6460786.1 hypothetical protein O3G_MSEX012211 [Manduca sexta]